MASPGLPSLVSDPQARWRMEPTGIVVERSETFQARSARTTGDLLLAKPLR